MADDPGTYILWVDVSHHDRNRRGGPLDWAAIRQATSPVMCARASYGDPAGFNPPSPYWAEFQTGAAAAEITVRGGYHNVIHGDAASIARQVDLLRSKLDEQGCTWGMADCEPYEELVTRNLWPRMLDIKAFHDRWYAVESRVLAWYVPMWFWQRDPANGPSLNKADLRGLRGPLVQSHYIAGNGRGPRELYAAAGGNAGTGWDDFYGGRYPDGWQYSSTCNCPGAGDATDVNAYRGTLDQLATMLTGQPIGDDMLKDEQLTLPAETLVTGELVPATGQTEVVDAASAVAFALRHSYVARKVAEATLEEVKSLKTGGVDVDALAAAIAALLPKPPTAEEVANVLAERLKA